jgi:hypothetical protein
MLTLIKQSIETGMVTNFWIGKDREELYYKLNGNYPDPALKTELAKDTHKVFKQPLTELTVGDNRFTLMVDHAV